MITDIFRSDKAEVNASPQVREDLLFSMKLNNLEPCEKFVHSVVNLNEIISTRHGIIVVGPSMSGKS
jgi:polynucleotide 5'-kinase involved in rRNA processing